MILVPVYEERAVASRDCEGTEYVDIIVEEDEGNGASEVVNPALLAAFAFFLNLNVCNALCYREP